MKRSYDFTAGGSTGSTSWASRPALPTWDAPTRSSTCRGEALRAHAYRPDRSPSRWARTGVYPSDTPGGWHLLGRADPCQLFDLAADPPSRFVAGDRVRFRPVLELPDLPRSGSAPAAPGRPDGDEALEVEDGGLSTTVQDLGRPGYQRYGVPVAGAADAKALSLKRIAGSETPPSTQRSSAPSRDRVCVPSGRSWWALPARIWERSSTARISGAGVLR